MTTEIGRSGVQAKHMKRVKAAGGKSYKFVSPGRRNVPDVIDLLGFDDAVRVLNASMPKPRLTDKYMRLLAERVVAAAIRFTECKAPKKKPRPGQQREIARIRKLGYRVDVVDA